MKNVTKPRVAVSFEDALRNLAAKLTGAPVHELPRTQEGIVQFMTDNIPSVDEIAEAITQEVISRLVQAASSEDETSEETEQPVQPENPEKPEEPEPPAAEGAGAETPPNSEQSAPETTEKPEEPAEKPKAKKGKKSTKSE